MSKTLVVHYKSDNVMISEDVASGKAKKSQRRFTIEALEKDGGQVEIHAGEAKKISEALAALSQ